MTRRTPSARASALAWPVTVVKRGSNGPSRAVSSASIANQFLAVPPLSAAGLTITATLSRRTIELQVGRLEPSALSDASQHSGSDFFAIMECEDKIELSLLG